MWMENIFENSKDCKYGLSCLVTAIYLYYLQVCKFSLYIGGWQTTWVCYLYLTTCYTCTNARYKFFLHKKRYCVVSLKLLNIFIQTDFHWISIWLHKLSRKYSRVWHLSDNLWPFNLTWMCGRWVFVNMWITSCDCNAFPAKAIPARSGLINKLNDSFQL